MSKYSELIARLEAAEGPSRELDLDISYGLGLPDWLFTGSVDAALTLVPEGPWSGEIIWRFGDLKIGGFVELNKANPAWLEPGYDYSEPPHAHAACVDSYSDQEPDPQPRPIPIAICIASLRAREAMEDAPA